MTCHLGSTHFTVKMGSLWGPRCSVHSSSLSLRAQVKLASPNMRDSVMTTPADSGPFGRRERPTDGSDVICPRLCREHLPSMGMRAPRTASGRSPRPANRGTGADRPIKRRRARTETEQYRVPKRTFAHDCNSFSRCGDKGAPLWFALSVPE